MNFRKIRLLFGVVCLVICAGLSCISVFSGVSMVGLHAGIVLFTGLGGLFLLVS